MIQCNLLRRKPDMFALPASTAGRNPRRPRPRSRHRTPSSADTDPARRTERLRQDRRKGTQERPRSHRRRNWRPSAKQRQPPKRNRRIREGTDQRHRKPHHRRRTRRRRTIRGIEVSTAGYRGFEPREPPRIGELVDGIDLARGAGLRRTLLLPQGPGSTLRTRHSRGWRSTSQPAQLHHERTPPWYAPKS